MKNTFMKVNCVCLLAFAVFFASCSQQEEYIKSDKQQQLSIKQQEFKELLQNPAFNQAYTKMLKKKTPVTDALNARTALEEQFGFTIVEDVPAKVITTGLSTSYTFLIKRESEDLTFFENLLIKSDSTNTASAEIIKYIPTTPIYKLSDHDGWDFSAIKEHTELFNDRFGAILHCNTYYYPMCSTLGGAYTHDHIANSDACIIDYYEVVTVCFSSGSSGGGMAEPTVISVNQIGGGGGSTEPVITTPIPCKKCVKDDETEEEGQQDCNTSKEQLQLVFPNTPGVTLEALAQMINQHGKDFGIDSKEKLQHFLAQTGHESGNFTALSENLNYSAAQLIKYWGNRFSFTDPTKLNPNDYANNPMLIGNLVYHNRMGNGNIASNDGYNFRGRGFLQLTGRSNYTAFQQYYNALFGTNLDILNNPDQVATDSNLAILSAMWFFKTNVLDKLNFNEPVPVKKVTKLVNGGTNGLSDRTAKFASSQLHIECL